MHDGRRLPTLFTQLLLSVIRGHQLVIAPLLPGSCRYVPSCSRYAQEAVLTHGAVRGSWMAFRRILHCHPFGGAGFDPVPGRVAALARSASARRAEAWRRREARHYRRRAANTAGAQLLDRRSLGEGGQPGQTEHARPHD